MSFIRFLAPAALVLCASATAAQPLSEATRAERILSAFSELCPIDDALGDPEAMLGRLSHMENGNGDEVEIIVRSHTPWPVEASIRWDDEDLGLLWGRDAVLCGILYRPIDPAMFDSSVTERFGVSGEQRNDSLMPGHAYWADRSTSRQVGPAPHTVWTVERGGTVYEIVSYTPAGGILWGRHVIWIRRPWASIQG